MKLYSLLFLLAAPCLSHTAPFRFKHHYIDDNHSGASWGQTALADIDQDGDLDFITGQSRGPIYWFEFKSASSWTRHLLGEQSPSDVGGAALDLTGDHHLDFVTGGAWYKNSGRPTEGPFTRFVFDPNLTAVHDVVAADLNHDGKTDIITMSDRNNLRWYDIPSDPTQPWLRHDIGPSVHAGVAVGDLDGDHDLDVVRSDLWFENRDGKGVEWMQHRSIPFGKPSGPYPLATRCVVADLDRDGDQDLVMTNNEIREGAIAWIENVDSKGRDWKLHLLPLSDTLPRGAFHSIALADFDGDGDSDIFTCEMEGIKGERPPRWYIWENRDGRGAEFVERVILDRGLGGHEAVVGDVDGDGDIDICSKLWRARNDNSNHGRNHVDFLENLSR